MSNNHNEEKYAVIFNHSIRPVKQRFTLDEKTIDDIKSKTPKFGFNGLGEVVFRRTYSRDGESWHDVVIRVIEGVMSIRKEHYYRNSLEWNDQHWQNFARDMALSMFDMEWLPPGRGLWMMGTEFTYTRGSMSLNNCACVDTKHDLVHAAEWTMDALMNGVGVGFSTYWRGVATHPDKTNTETYVIPDSREGWVASLIKLLCAYIDSPRYGKGKFPTFDYSQIRPQGLPIKGFGGQASGPAPLKKLHERVEKYLDMFCEGKSPVFKQGADYSLQEVDGETKPYTHTRLIADIFNAIGACVVAGNVRRCLPGDAEVFTKGGLKNIRDIEVGDDVLTSKGYEKIINKFVQGEQKLVKIITQDGEFRCTPNHRMAVCSSYDTYVWKQAQELVKGDRLMTSRMRLPGTKTKLPGDNVPDLDSDMAWFIGAFQQKGSYDGDWVMYKSTNVVKVSQQLSRFEECEMYRGFQKSSFYITCKQSKDLVSYMKAHVKDPEHLRVPSYIKNGTFDIRMNYIHGLIDSGDNAHLGVITTDQKKFAQDIQNVIYSCGFDSRQTKTNEKYTISFITKRSQIVFSSFIQRSKNINGFPGTFEKTQLMVKYGLYDDNQLDIDLYDREYGEGWFTPVEVVDIVPDNEEETFDIEVENQHEFFCNGYLTHNSAEICLGDVDDKEFINLKNYEQNPERAEIGWMSNNSVVLQAQHDYEDFSYIPDMASRIRDNGEPGMINLYNIQKYGRFGKEMKDNATMVNPCFSGDTLIAVADGRGCVPIKQLAEEGKDVPVYSIDKVTGEVSIKWGRNPRVTGENKQLVRVHFDGNHKGEYLDVTPNHVFILNDGTESQAWELDEGDSLPRFKKTKFSDGYVRVHLRNKKYRVEHRMIKEFYEESKFYTNYEEGVYNGCCLTHGVVVHHKDDDKTNNHPDNLEITTASEHNRIHNQEYVGAGNPMYGKNHTEETKRLIGQKAKERCEDPAYRLKLSIGQTEEHRRLSSIKMKQQKREWDIKTCNEQEVEAKRCGLRVNRIAETKLRVVKICENDQCKKEFETLWAKREQGYCSRSCGNTKKVAIEARKKGQTVAFENKAKLNFHKQAMIYKDLEKKEPVRKSEWDAMCKKNGVTYRFNNNSPNPWIAPNWTAFKQMVDDYNHRVSYVEDLDGEHTVYNITVDDNHTLAVVTKTKDNNLNLSGVFTAQCGEIPLESEELCVGKDTRILTHLGCPYISDMVGKTVEIWNGKKWSTVTPFQTGSDKVLYRVTMSDGSYLDVTNQHKWSVHDDTSSDNGTYKEVKTRDLKIGMKLETTILKSMNFDGVGVNVPNVYTWGLFAGNGYISDDKLYISKERPKDVTRKLQDIELATKLCESIPDMFFTMDTDSIYEFINGWTDSDVRYDSEKSIALRSTSRQKLLDAQLLLRRIGVNNTKIITEYNTHVLLEMTDQPEQIVSKIERLEGLHDTFCFTEPNTHKGMFNNVLTHQCNLAETFPPRCLDSDRFYRAAEYATFYASTVSLLPTHRPETNAVIARNRRIGVSISGIAQWASGEVPDGWGSMNYTKMTKFLRNAYKIIRETNTALAKEAGVPESVRVTTVKPSGSISLLAGVTPGVHYPVSRYAIRRMRIGNDSPLVQPLIDAGIPHEPDTYSDNTLVFEFAIDHGSVRPCEQVSPWEQFALVAMMQKHYADNCVSATIYFDKDKDGPDVEKMLAMYISLLKSVSMLPHSGHGYAQAPYEPIDEETYNRRKNGYSLPNFSNVRNNVPVGSKYCSGDSCEFTLPEKK